MTLAHRRGTRALVRALALSLIAVAGAPSHAAVSPFPPTPLGNVAVGSQLQADVSLPLTTTVTQIPAAFDAQVVFTSGSALEDAALALVSLTSPVTVAQLKAQHPTWGVTIPVPTVALSAPSGMYALTSLGCNASECGYRVTFAPTAPGVYPAQLTAAVASITFNEGGLLGTLANAFAPFLLGIVNASLVFDFSGTGVALQAVPAVSIPSTGDAALLALAAVLAVAGMLAIARRARYRRQASGR